MAKEIGIAKVVKGQMTAAGPEGNRGLQEGSPVFKGDTISTAKGAAGSIEFLDKTVLNVGEASKVNLNNYVYDADKGTGQALFKMAQGTFRTVTGEIVKHNPESFKMQSPLATIGIRGTETGHTIPAGGGGENHLVMVFDGKPVIVQPLGGGAFQVLSQAGVKVEVGKFGAGPVLVMTPNEFKYFQALTQTGIQQQGAPTDTISTGQNAGQSQVNAAQDASAKASADAAAKAAAESAAKAAAEAAAKAAAEAEKAGDPAAKAAAEAAAKAAAEAAAKAAIEAKAAAELAAKAAAEAAAALQAQALAEAAAKAAADLAAQQGQLGQQGTQLQGQFLNLTQGSIFNLNQFTGPSGLGNPGGPGGPGNPGGLGTFGDGTNPLLISQAAQDFLNQIITTITEQPDNPLSGITTENSLLLTTKAEGQFVDLDPSDQNTSVVSLRDSAYYESSGNHENWVQSSYSNAFEPGVTAISSTVVNVTGSEYNDEIYGNNSANLFYGGSGADLIYGRGGKDIIEGGEGNDTIYGGADADLIDGGADFDAIYGDAGNDTLSGGLGNDTIMGGIDNDSISGGDGNDMLNGEDGMDVIGGGDGNDTIIGGADNDTLTAGAGIDSFQGGTNDDLIYMESNLTADDTVDGGTGNDTLYFADNGLGTNDLDNVQGVEQVYISGASSALIYHGMEFSGSADATMWDAVGGKLIINASSLSAGEALNFNGSAVGNYGYFQITGSAGDDTIKGSDARTNSASVTIGDLLSGGAGNDTFIATQGRDTMAGGLGSDTLDYSDLTSNPLNITSTADQTGGASFNTLAGSSLHSYSGIEIIKGGGGADTIDLANWTSAATVYGNDGNDSIFGGSCHDYLEGGLGIDVLHGNAGNDTIYGGDGDDTLNGGAGNNHLHGDAGIDMVSYGNATGAVTANLSTGSVTANGYGGTDTLYDIEKYYGSNHGDTVTAGATTVSIALGTCEDTVYMGTYLSSTDTVSGGSGSDTLHLDNSSGNTTDLANVTGFEHITLSGTSANLAATNSLFSNVDNVGMSPAVYVDGASLSGTLTFDGSATSAGYLYITGSSGNDSLVGGGNTGGGDHLYGSGGADTMTGGAGPDLFIYKTQSEGGDTISDFLSGTDKFAFYKTAAGGDFGFSDTATAQGHVFNTLTDYMNAADTNAACWVRDDDFNILKFDDDGYAGAHAAVTIANNVSNITSTDIIIVNSSHVEV